MIVFSLKQQIPSFLEKAFLILAAVLLVKILFSSFLFPFSGKGVFRGGWVGGGGEGGPIGKGVL